MASTTTPSTLSSVLKTPVSDILPKQDHVVVIDAKEPLPVAFHILSKNNIYSAPVYDSSKNEFCGFLDMVDVVAYIVKIFEDMEDKKGGVHKGGLPADFYTLLEQVCKFDQAHASSVADLSKRNPLCPLRPTSTVDDALRIFCKTGTHRIPIFVGDKLVSILTQSMTIAWLSKHVDLLGDLGKRTIQGLGVGLKEVVSVAASDRAIDAFKLMNQHRVNAVAVLESDNTLMTTLSAKDIKVLDTEALFTKLYKNVVEYVSAARSHELITTAPAMSCHLETPFKEVIGKLGVSHRHRCWIVSDKKHLLGVISLKDVLQVIINEEDKVERIMK